MKPKFTSPPDPHAFRLMVWEVVKRIPPGKVATYGQIANYLPVPSEISDQDYHAFGARWVGGAMSACPPDVPWQRVVNAQGKISLSGREKITQQQLLEMEGVIFDEKGKINLRQFQWNESGQCPDQKGRPL